MARYGKTHGLHNTKTYKSWQSMKSRCTNINDPSYPQYGGKGVTYCPEWELFQDFLKDMGERPESTTLDRINNSEGYYKDNCRWASYKTQARNRRDNRYITFEGETRCFLDWCSHLGIPRSTLNNRLLRGWDIERAFTTPVERQYG